MLVFDRGEKLISCFRSLLGSSSGTSPSSSIRSRIILANKRTARMLLLEATS